jgi:cell division protease FtsH
MSPQDERRDRTNSPTPPWRNLWWLPLLLLVLIGFTIGHGAPRQVANVSYTAFKQEARAGDITSVTFRGDQITGHYTKAYAKKQAKAENSQGAPLVERFTTTLPSVNDPQLLGLLEKQNVTVSAQSTQRSWWEDAVVMLLPWVLILGLIYYASRKMQRRMMGGGSAGLFSFGKTRAKRFQGVKTRVTFNDVAGSEGAKSDLQEIIEYLKNPLRYRALGANIPRGVLLMGPPGTGKTLLAKAVAGEAGVPFFSVSASEFIEMFVGVGAARVRDTFKSAKDEAPAIIFVDELDSVGRARGAGLGGGHDEREQTLNQILSEMDGFSTEESVVVLAATNRPDVLDPALLRPGRFDRKVVTTLPDRRAREQILRIHARKVPLAGDVDLGLVASRTIGFAGADLQNLINEAALLAGRDNKREVDMRTLERARDKIVLGAERETILSDAEKSVVAYHESGHALLAWLLPDADPLDKVTIVPHGRALGVTQQTPQEDHYNLKRGYLLDRITVMLGGHAAEKIVFGDMTTGAEQDLEQATQLTRRMVCRWGMSEALGPVSYRRGEEHVFLGRELAQQRDFSEHTAQLIDDEIRRQLTELEQKAEALLKRERAKLESLARALMQRETLDRSDIERLFKVAA